MDLTETRRQEEQLAAIFVQKGASVLIAYAADDIVKLRAHCAALAAACRELEAKLAEATRHQKG